MYSHWQWLHYTDTNCTALTVILPCTACTLHYIALHCTVYNSTLHSWLHCIALHCTALHFVQQYTALQTLINTLHGTAIFSTLHCNAWTPNYIAKIALMTTLHCSAVHSLHHYLFFFLQQTNFSVFVPIWLIFLVVEYFSCL